MNARVKPPFRADHVGSLLRTGPLKIARAQGLSRLGDASEAQPQTVAMAKTAKYAA